MKPEFPNASESVKRLNPHLFAVGAVETRQSEQAAPLVSRPQGQQAGKTSVGYRVCLVAHLKRPMDGHDNLRASLKPLVDAIAATLGIDDGDKRIEWDYHQIKDRTEGVAVKITETKGEA